LDFFVGDLKIPAEHEGVGSLEQAAKDEPFAFFTEVLSKNLPITSFIDSDFVVVNERLATVEFVGSTAHSFASQPYDWFAFLEDAKAQAGPNSVACPGERRMICFFEKDPTTAVHALPRPESHVTRRETA
jgi:hypothetical protein